MAQLLMYDEKNGGEKVMGDSMENRAKVIGGISQALEHLEVAANKILDASEAALAMTKLVRNDPEPREIKEDVPYANQSDIACEIHQLADRVERALDNIQHMNETLDI